MPEDFKYKCPSCGHGFDDDRIEDEKEEKNDRLWIKRALKAIHEVQTRIERTQEKIMGDQANLDADVAALNTGIAAVAQEIKDLKAANPALDLSGLEASLTSFADLLPPAVVVPPTV